MRAALVATLLALPCGSCAAVPAQAPTDDSEDIALLWSARLPGAVEGPVVLETRDVAYLDVPRVAAEDASSIDGLALLGGTLLVRRVEVLGTEQLVVIAPASKWVTTSGALRGPEPRPGDDRLEVVLGVEPGSSSAVMFHVEGSLLDQQMVGKGSPPARRIAPAQIAVIGLDVVWPSSSEAPIMTTTVARVDRGKDLPRE